MDAYTYVLSTTKRTDRTQMGQATNGLSGLMVSGQSGFLPVIVGACTGGALKAGQWKLSFSAGPETTATSAVLT